MAKKKSKARKYKEGQIVVKNGVTFKVVSGCLRRYEEPLCESEGLALRRFEEYGCTRGTGKKSGSFRKGKEAAERRFLGGLIGRDGSVRRVA